MFSQLNRELLELAGAKPAPRCACGHRRDEHNPNPEPYVTRSGHEASGRKCRVEIGPPTGDPPKKTLCPCTHYHPRPT